MVCMPSDQVELSSVEVLPGGAGFVLEARNAHQQAVRMEFPVWA